MRRRSRSARRRRWQSNLGLVGPAKISTGPATGAIASPVIGNVSGGTVMAGEALFVGGGQVVRGREQLALQVFQEAVGYYGKLQEDGQIERFDAYLLDPHGGDLAGLFLLHGERSALDTIRS